MNYEVLMITLFAYVVACFVENNRVKKFIVKEGILEYKGKKYSVDVINRHEMM